MIIKSIRIDKFRAMSDVELKIGCLMTAIAGRNATMKTTLLGMLGQPFSISKTSPMYGEHTIDGYNYRSQFNEKFKLSKVHDVAGDHKWTLNFVNTSFYHNDHIEMISTNRTGRGTSSSIRFISSEGKIKGKGYVQLPVIYLSLSRIYPIGEAGATTTVPVTLNNEEIALYTNWYREVLSISDQGALSVCIEKHDSKRVFTGVSDDIHDLHTNSAGEGNIGRILVSILSFKRLKEKYAKDYRGGILLIDELDATLYGYSQIKLVRLLHRVSMEYKIQIIFTTHSPLVLETVNELQRKEIKELSKQSPEVDIKKYAYKCEIIQLTPQYSEGSRKVEGQNIHSALDLRKTIDDINLNPTRSAQNINVYFEDQRAFSLLEFILKKKGIDTTQYFKCMDVDLGWTNYLQLHKKSIPEFRRSIIILDCDVKTKNEYTENWKEYIDEAENIMFFPVDVESGIFKLFKDRDNYKLFEEKLNRKNILMSYDICFRDYVNPECTTAKEYKTWFRYVEAQAGDINMLFEVWYEKNKRVANNFVREFVEKYNKIAESQGMDEIIIKKR